MTDEYGSQRPCKDSERKTLGYRFSAVAFPFYGDVSLGNMTMYKMYLAFVPNGRFLVGIENKGLYTFEHWCHWTYAQEKLNLTFESDARAVADFINCQLGHIHDEDQGVYDERYC